MHLSKPQKIQGLNEISNKYDIYFVDLWGVMHNGVECYPEAINVLEKLKKNNKKIILISNAPRPNKTVNLFLEKIGLPKSLYDLLVTSGDVTQEYLGSKLEQGKFFHLGPDRDRDLFVNTGAQLANKEDCNEIVCTGLTFAETEDVQDYESVLNFFK